MGIPAFYRWLVDRYPRSVVDVLEDSPPVVNGVRMPVDTTKPNPNGFEFDNLYLDMNGIIHPCFHPENGSPPKSYDEVFAAIFKYIDRIFSLVRPRKLLFMAIDGVAPRAKMNQQRARRFRAAKDAADAASLLEKKGCGHAEKDKSLLDSNIITPGTGFMESLSAALQFYVHLRINTDPSWKGVKVILSDATVPGEGEHKIMSYIRLQRNLPGFDPHTRHCLYGLDADLIMLALATHEVHFSVLREDIRRVPPKFTGHNNNKRTRNGILKPNEPPSEFLEDIISRQKFQFLNVWILRDYLAESLRIPDPSVKADLERLIDDFVFMCLFVGNDFLPHVPSLEISEGAIDLLMSVYKKEFVRMGGYLTDASEVNLKGVEHFVQILGSHENAIFKKRRQEQISWERHARHVPDTSIVADKVNLGEEGWKERYYTEKFEVQTDDDRARVKNHAVLKYVEGICWVMHYYYQGVCSWQWFYPYHYAPFASDFQGLDMLNIHFELGKPFKPFDQLMGVLPAASGGALPLSYRKLMTDQSSPILDLYPTDFDLDLNGRKQAWKAICKLPFIDEARLLSEIAKVENTLTDVERRRNTLGIDKLFFDMSHPLAEKIFIFWERNKDNPKLQKAKVKTRINPELSGGMNGYVYVSDQPVCPPEIPSPLPDMKTITNNKVLAVLYKFPDLHPHIPRLPKGVKMPPKTIGRHDLPLPPSLWHEKSAISLGRFTSRPIPPKAIAGSYLAKISHQLVSGTYSSQDRGNVANTQHQLVSGINSSEYLGNVNKQVHDPSGEEKKKKRRKKRSKSIAGSCPDQHVSGISSSEDRGNIVISDQLVSSEGGGDVAKISHQLVSGINGREDQENVNKQSLDAVNQSWEKEKRGEDVSSDTNMNLCLNLSNDEKQRVFTDRSLNVSRINTSEEGGNVAKTPHQLVSGINSSEYLGNVNKQVHDPSGEKKKKRKRKKRSKLIAGSCLDQLVSGISSSEDRRDIVISDQLVSSEGGEDVAKISHQLVSGINGREDQENVNKQSLDAVNQSWEKEKRGEDVSSDTNMNLCPNLSNDETQRVFTDRSLNVSRINTSEEGGNVAKTPHQLVSGINSSEYLGNVNKQAHDPSGEKKKRKRKRKKRSKSIAGSCPDQLVSGISSSEDRGNIVISDQLVSSEVGGDVAKISHQIVSGINGREDQENVNRQSLDTVNQSWEKEKRGEDISNDANMNLSPNLSNDEKQRVFTDRSLNVSRINTSEEGGNVAKTPHQLVSGINSSEYIGNVNKQVHDPSGEKKKKRKRKKRSKSIAGSCPDQLVSGISSSEDRGNIVISDQLVSSEGGGDVAKISHQLVSGIIDREDQENVSKQSLDTVNQSWEKEKRGEDISSDANMNLSPKFSNDEKHRVFTDRSLNVSRINTSEEGGNVAKTPHQLVSGINSSEYIGNVNKQAHDPSGEKKKRKRKRKKRPVSSKSIAGSCPDQLVSGIFSGEAQRDINKQNNDSLNQSEDGGKMANISHPVVSSNEEGGNVVKMPDQLVSGIHKQSHDALNQSEEKKKKRRKKRPIPTKSTAGSCPDQLASGIFSGEAQSDINKQNNDSLNQSEYGGKMANISHPLVSSNEGGNVVKMPDQLVSGIFSGEAQSDINKQNNDSLKQSEDGGKMANISRPLVSINEEGGNVVKMPDQLVSGIFSGEAQSDINKQNNDSPNQSEYRGKMANISHPLVSSNEVGNVVKMPDQLVSGIFSGEAQSNINKQNNDSLNQSEDGGKMANISHPLVSINEEGGNVVKMPDQLVSGIHSSENLGDINQQTMIL